MEGHEGSVEFLYPEKPRAFEITIEQLYTLITQKYRPSYSIDGNLSVSFDGEHYVTGNFSFVVRNVSRQNPLFVFVAYPNNRRVLWLNLTIEDVLVNLSRAHYYVRTLSGTGWAYRVYFLNFTSSKETLRGRLAYKLDYGYFVSNGIIQYIMSPITQWFISPLDDVLNVTLYVPNGSMVFVPYEGVFNSSVSLENVNFSRSNYIFFIGGLYVRKDLTASNISVHVFIPKACYRDLYWPTAEMYITGTLTYYYKWLNVTLVNDVYILLRLGSVGRDFKGLTWGRYGLIVIDCVGGMSKLVNSDINIFYHELAHLWFGGYANFGRLNEGFATYLEWRMLDVFGHRKYFFQKVEEEVIRYHSRINIASALDLRSRGYSDPAVTAMIYNKAAFAFRSLELVMGRETFDRALEDLLRDCQGTYCDLTTVQVVFENVSGQDLGWFFEEWFNSTKLPDYKIENLTLSSESGSYSLTFTITDTSNFIMPLEIRTVTEDGRFIDKTVWVNGSAEVSFKLDAKPMRIILDPNEWMVNENKEYDVNGIKVIVE